MTKNRDTIVFYRGDRRVILSPILTILSKIYASKGSVSNKELQNSTGYSRAHVKKIIVTARNQFGVDISWDKTQRIYKINDWGFINARAVKHHCKEID